MMKRCPLIILSLSLLIVLAILQIALPPRQKSDMENRYLQTGPEISLSAFAEGKGAEKFESWAADQIPLRDEMVSAWAVIETTQGKTYRNGVLFGSEGRILDPGFDMSTDNALRNADAFSRLCQLTGLPGAVAIAPTSANVYASALPAMAPTADEEALFSTVKECISGRNEWIDLVSVMKGNSAEKELYYRTDHHWTDDGAYLAYRTICGTVNRETVGQGIPTPYDGFFGTYFARSPSPLTEGDMFMLPACDAVLSIDGEPKKTVYDPEALLQRDKYAALLWGNHGVIRLQNDEAPEGTLLILKDSYANAVIPYLAGSYSTVIAVDPRYFGREDIVQFVKEKEADQLLCLFGINTFSTQRYLYLLQGL